jgi:hypothetical protein
MSTIHETIYQPYKTEFPEKQSYEIHIYPETKYTEQANLKKNKHGKFTVVLF